MFYNNYFVIIIIIIIIIFQDCDLKTAKCHVFNCSIGELRPGQSVVVRLRARLWNSTFLTVMMMMMMVVVVVVVVVVMMMMMVTMMTAIVIMMTVMITKVMRMTLEMKLIFN